MSDETHVHVHAPKGVTVHVHVHETEAELVIEAIEDVKSEPEKIYIPLPYPTPHIWPLPSWPPHDYRHPPLGYIGDWPWPQYTVTCKTVSNLNTDTPNGSTVVYWQKEGRS